MNTDKANKVIASFTDMFAERVRSRRQELGITQDDLVNSLQKCGLKVSQGYISLIEGKSRRDPSLKIVVALAVLLDISFDEILTDDCS